MLHPWFSNFPLTMYSQTTRLHTGKWIPVVGLEVHVQIASKSKLFSLAGTSFTSPPNKSVSFIDVALPGTLPVRKISPLTIKTCKWDIKC